MDTSCGQLEGKRATPGDYDSGTLSQELMRLECMVSGDDGRCQCSEAGDCDDGAG